MKNAKSQYYISPLQKYISMKLIPISSELYLGLTTGEKWTYTTYNLLYAV